MTLIQLKTLTLSIRRNFPSLSDHRRKWSEIAITFLESSGNNTGHVVAGNIEDDFRKYLKLYRASAAGNWEEAENFLSHHSHAIQAPINHHLDTALHVAAKATAGDDAAAFAEKLVAKMMGDDDDEGRLAIKNRYGLTALHVAARFGNTAVAGILVGRNYKLLYDRCEKGLFPIHYAACNTRKSVEVYRYFWDVTKDDEDGEANPYAGPSGSTILVNLIKSKFYDVAADFVDKYPDLIRHQTLDKTTTPLEAIVKYDYPIINKPSPSFWQTTIYYLSKRNEMAKQKEAVKLLECLCNKLKTLNDDIPIASSAMLEATQLDIDKVVLNILEENPEIAYCQDNNGKNILHIAVENRCRNVFNLVCGTRVLMHDLVEERDNKENNIVHLAGKLAPSKKLNLVSGAAIQMQRELQWFKEVQKIAPPYFSSLMNRDGKTPDMVFREEHKVLKTEGEKWMKDTSTSCTIAAALIVTVVFAAAITVPGGNDDKTGLPILFDRNAFTIFYYSNGASLFTSVTSLLVFVSILTSRYAEEDFLYALPRRLIIGIFTLLLSIIFMMAAFSTTVYLIFGKRRSEARIILIVVACVPVTSFVLLQFRLLVALLSSTYGRGIFDQRGTPHMLF